MPDAPTVAGGRTPIVAVVGALLALVSSLSWGAADFIGGTLSRRLPALAVYGWSQAVGCVVLLVIATVAGGWTADPGYWPWAILASISGLIAMIAFYTALAEGPMGLVSPLASLSVLVPLSIALLAGETPTSVQILGIVLAVMGILLASGPELSGAESARPLALSVLAAIAFGIVIVALAQGSQTNALMTITAMRVITVMILLVVLLVVRHAGGVGRRDLAPLAVLGVLDAGGNLLLAVATTMALLSITSVLGSLYPVVTAVLAAIFLHERLRPVQYVGVVAAMIGVVLIASGD